MLVWQPMSGVEIPSRDPLETRLTVTAPDHGGKARLVAVVEAGSSGLARASLAALCGLRLLLLKADALGRRRGWGGRDGVVGDGHGECAAESGVGEGGRSEQGAGYKQHGCRRKEPAPADEFDERPSSRTDDT